MNQLLQGMETRKKIDCLLAQTKIEDGPKTQAIYFHLVEGCAQSRAAIMFGVKQSKLSEALEKLNKVAEHNERYHELKVHEPDRDEAFDARIANVLSEWVNAGGSETDTAEAIEDIKNLFIGVPA